MEFKISLPHDPMMHLRLIVPSNYRRNIVGICCHTVIRGLKLILFTELQLFTKLQLFRAVCTITLVLSHVIHHLCEGQGKKQKRVATR